MHRIVEYWSKLEGTVHPEDAAVFAKFHGHGLNLDFPPPAYIGDIVNAPVIILDNNGGYGPATADEFAAFGAQDEYRAAMRASRPLDHKAGSTSPYYLNRNYTQMLRSGEAALVNGVAYRSTDGRARHMEELTSLLPSARFHRMWLMDAVVPALGRGDRFLIVHRWKRWEPISYGLRGLPNTIFSTAPVSKDLTRQELDMAAAFLKSRRTG